MSRLDAIEFLAQVRRARSLTRDGQRHEAAGGEPREPAEERRSGTRVRYGFASAFSSKR